MTLKVAIYRYRAPEVHPWLEAFAEGLRRHGAMTTERAYNPSAEELAQGDQVDVHVFWSMRAEGIFEHCRATGQTPVCLEHGYTRDRREFTSVNFWGLNGESQLLVPDGDDSRRRRHGWSLGWRDRQALSDNTRVVVMGQLKGDKSLKGVDSYAWARRAITECVNGTELSRDDFYFKPHPLEKFGDVQDVGAELLVGERAAAALSCARAVLTLSSTSGPEAWMAGVPAVAASPISMIHHSRGFCGGRDARQRWLNDISFRQFSTEEFSAGLPWDLYGSQMREAEPDTSVPDRGMGSIEALAPVAPLLARELNLLEYT